MRLATIRLTAVALMVSAAAFLSGCNGDTSTPKKAALAFGKAFEAGDSAAAAKLCTGTDAQIKAMKSAIDSIGAVKRLDDAMARKFGEDSRMMKATNKQDLGKDMEAAVEKIDGDTATVTNSKSPTPMKLKKVDGAWKIDLTDMPFNGATALSDDSGKAMVATYDQIAKNVDDGKYKSAAEAQMDFQKKVGEAMMNPGKK